MYLMEDAESLLGELEYEPSTSDLQMKDEGTQRAKTSKNIQKPPHYKSHPVENKKLDPKQNTIQAFNIDA